MQNKNISVVKTCPYCFREISNDDACFLIRTDGARFQSPVFNEIFSPKMDQPYLYFWSSMGMPEDQIDARRIVVDNDTLVRMNQELALSQDALAKKSYEEETCGYTFHANEAAVSVFSNTMLCPHCHNELPHNFFCYDMLMIGLAGSVASGKTVYLSSLLMNSFACMQRENLTVRSASGNPYDPYRMEMERNADRLMYEGICPESTSKTFRKPLFLDVTYQIEHRTFHMLTAIYDVAGELIRESTGTGRTGFVRYMDGYRCLVDPAQMHLEHSFIGQSLPDEAAVLSRLHLMSPQEQITIQKMSNDHEKQILDQADFMKEAMTGEGFLSQRKADVLLDTLRSVLGEAGLKEKYMALTIAKSDLIEDLGEIRSFKASSLLFDRSQVSYGFMNMDAHFLRQDILQQIFDQKVFRLQRNLSDYKSSAMFAVSALGCETKEVIGPEGKTVKTVGKVRPIRVEEPVLWMIMQYMRERGWLD